MSAERWFRTPRRLPPLFLVVTLVPIVALGWLTWQLLDRERRLETQQAQERVEHAADRIVAASHQRLADLENELQRLAVAGSGTPPDGTVRIVAEGDRVTVTPPGALVYHPVLSSDDDVPRQVFAEGERFEYQQRDLIRAIAWFQTLARTDQPAVRAGALVRLGRNQQKAGQADAALVTYEQLAGLGATSIDGLPAALLALVASCGVLERAGRQAELAAAAAALRDGLSNGAWPLPRDAYDFYLDEARRLTGDADETEADRNAHAIAAAFESVHERWTSEGAAPQRRWLIAEGRPVLAASTGSGGRLTTILAGPDFLKDAWHDLEGARVLLTDGEGQPILETFPRDAWREPGNVAAALPVVGPTAVRPADASKLPWTLRVTSTGVETDSSAATLRRQLVLSGFAFVLILFAGSAYFTLRGVTRELAVARLQSDFVAAVSHEFRTPLASVRHLSDMLSKGRVKDEEERQRSYDFLSRESERLQHLVEELLDFGRIEAGAYRYRFEPVEVADLLRDLVAEFQEKVTPSGLRIDLSDADARAIVRADRDALSRAIWNLLDNAVKYSPGADTIWVSLALEDGSAVIRVRDRGLGIALGEQEDIFRKFVRGTSARTEQIKGTGIGLAIVRHIVEAHHGDVHVESRPQHGSTFALRLPIERAA